MIGEIYRGYQMDFSLPSDDVPSRRPDFDQMIERYNKMARKIGNLYPNRIRQRHLHRRVRTIMRDTLRCDKYTGMPLIEWVSDTQLNDDDYGYFIKGYSRGVKEADRLLWKRPDVFAWENLAKRDRKRNEAHRHKAGIIRKPVSMDRRLTNSRDGNTLMVHVDVNYTSLPGAGTSQIIAESGFSDGFGDRVFFWANQISPFVDQISRNKLSPTGRR
ncbi:hypothetical protein HYW87_04365 [Candidatus Roizmanbacteria bacterium]|nr:hypothetical protein [Candidatus Roizmanbacteria bacterium]